MAKDQDQAQIPAQDDPGSQLGAIQNIIIGPAMAELTRRLAIFQDTINQHTEEVDGRFQNLADKDLNSLRSEIGSLHQQLADYQQATKEAVDRLAQQKTDRERLGKLLVELGQSLIEK
jgi:chromosome segregation ATPase